MKARDVYKRQHVHDLEAASDDASTTEAAAHLFRCGVGGDVIVLGDKAGDQVAHLSLIHISMCIRDSRKTVAAASVKSRGHTPVSYTHLDVYKRQIEKQGKDDVLAAVPGSGMGLLRGDDAGKARPVKSLAAHYMPQSGSVDALILTKTNARASIHRQGYMDYIGVLGFDAKGRATSEQRFLGLYTSSCLLYTSRCV